MLQIMTVLIMLAVAYAFWREGLMTAATTFVNVILAGIVAFNFWEPLADVFEPVLAGSILAGYEDAIVMLILFALTLGILRLATNNLCNKDLEYPPALLRGGGLAFGLLTGYLVAGFLVCLMQTLPWHKEFWWFEPEVNDKSPTAVIRHVLPADRVWLGLMYRTGAYGLCDGVDAKACDAAVRETKEKDPSADPDAVIAAMPATRKYITFDKYGSFELRYARYRRYDDDRSNGPLKEGVIEYQGECTNQTKLERKED
jgi:uncharacterized membrane protein required for colicin V production